MQESKLPSCPFCSSKQLEVVKIGIKDPDRDLIKCRHCRGQAMRKYWNTRHITLSQAKQVLAEAGMAAVPLEPTSEMIAALGFNGDVDMAIGHAVISESVVMTYKAMIKAAQDKPDA